MRAATSAEQAYAPPCGVVSGGLPHDYKRKSLVIGPLAIYAARSWARYPARFMKPVHAGADRFPPFESGMTVDAGHTVTLTIARPDRPYFAWLFDHHAYVNSSRGYRIADGERAIRLVGCGRQYGQYHGGFVIDGPRCVGLDIAIDGLAAVRRTLAIGSTARCGPRTPLPRAAAERQSASGNVAQSEVSNTQSAAVTLPPGRSAERYTITAPAPRTHVFDVRVQATPSADIAVRMRTANGGTLRIIDSTRSCGPLAAGPPDCFVQFPLLEAQHAGQWTVVVTKRSQAPAVAHVAIRFHAP